MEEPFIFYLVLIPLLGVAAQWLAWKLQIPSILLLLGFGIFLGLWRSPDEILAEITDSDETVGPHLLFPFVSLSVAIILFEGGLTLRLKQLANGGRIVMRLIFLASMITWIVTALVAHLVLGFSWQLASLLGAILMVTGPTVIGPLLRQIQPNRRVSSVLQWESILIDPIGAVAAVLAFEVISQPAETGLVTLIAIILRTLLVGSLVGLAGGFLLVISLRKYWVPDFLHGVFFLTVALFFYWISSAIQAESGLVAVTLMGILLANQPYVSVAHVLEFKEHLRVFLISCLFILLGSRLQLSALADIGWVGIPFILIVVFVIRPLSVFVSTIGLEWPWKERLFVGLVAPRGIVAASVASVFGLKLVSLGEPGPPELYDKAELLAPTTFLVILGTVALCGLGAGPLARRLGLADSNPQGILFGGASRWVREVATALRRCNIQVALIDTNFANVTAAKLQDLNAICGNILSEHLRESLELSGIGKFLAVTPSDEVNTLAALELTHLYTRANVYQLPTRTKSNSRWDSISENRRGRILFQNTLTHQSLEQMFENGAKVKVTTITTSFTMKQFRLKHGEDSEILFAISPDGRLKIRTALAPFEPIPGDRVIAVVTQGGDTTSAESTPPVAHPPPMDEPTDVTA